jgi:hypothetical protein
MNLSAFFNSVNITFIYRVNEHFVIGQITFEQKALIIKNVKESTELRKCTCVLVDW